MTIYFAGTERDAVEGGAAVVTSAGLFNNLYSRSALQVTRGAPSGFTFPDEIDTTDFWVAYTSTSYGNNAGGNAAAGPVLKLLDAAGNTAVYVNVPQNTGAAARVQVYNTAGLSATSPTWTWQAGYVLVRYDFHLYNSGETVVCDAYANNLLVATVSLSGTHRPVKVVQILGPDVSMNINTYGIGNSWVSELVIADESTLGLRVKTFPPTGNGTQTLWDGDYTNVDDPGIGLTSIATNLPGAAETFTHGYTMADGTAIRAIIVGASAGSNEADGVHAMLGGYELSFLKPLSPSASQNLAIYETNPATGNPYTAAEFNSLEFGVRSAESV